MYIIFGNRLDLYLRFVTSAGGPEPILMEDISILEKPGVRVAGCLAAGGWTKSTLVNVSLIPLIVANVH